MNRYIIKSLSIIISILILISVLFVLDFSYEIAKGREKEALDTPLVEESAENNDIVSIDLEENGNNSISTT